MTNEELCQAINNGTGDNNSLLLQLMRQNYGFIYQQAKKWAAAFADRPDIDIEDLTQSAFLAVLDAVQRYDPDRGKFISILSYTLKAAFSEACGMYSERRRKDPLNRALSLDDTCESDSDTPFVELVPDNSSEEAFEAVDDEIIRQQLHELLQKALATIPKKEARAINAHYLQGKTQAEIREEMNVSGSYVSAIIRSGIRRLRNCNMVNELSEALYGEMNLYNHTGFQSWKNSGYSQPEYMLEMKDKKLQKIISLMNDYGLSAKEARRMVDY